MAILEKCEIYYAKLDPKRPNKRFDKENPTWEVQLRTKDKAQKKSWEEKGLPVRAVVPDEGEAYFRLNVKKKIKKANGEDSSPVEVIDHNLKPIDPRIVGNGSIGNIRLFQYDKKDGSGKVAVLMGVQILKLVKFEPKNMDDEFTATEGGEVVEADQQNDEDGFQKESSAPAPASPSPSVSPKPPSSF